MRELLTVLAKMASLQLALCILATACIHVQTQSICNVTSTVCELKEMMKKQEEKIEDLASDMKACYQDKPYDCAALYDKGERSSGVYTIYPYGGSGMRVYCDMVTDGGGWTVFQKRHKGDVDFYRGWKQYTHGFGDPKGDYWLGLRHLHFLTQGQTKELYVGLTDFDLGPKYAKYGIFYIDTEIDKYRLTVGSYSGNAGDSLSYHNGQKFSTRDQDNDWSHIHCSTTYHGAWWYYKCYESNLNGRFSATKVVDRSYMAWYDLHNNFQSMKTSVMMIRPANFKA